MKCIIFILTISLVSVSQSQRRQGPPSISLNLPAPFPSLVLVPQIPIPAILPQQAQVLDIVSQAVGQIGRIVNAPILVRPAGSPPILPTGITTTALISNAPIRGPASAPAPATAAKENPSPAVQQQNRPTLSVRPVAASQSVSVRPVASGQGGPVQSIQVRPVATGGPVQTVQVRPVAQRGYYFPYA